MTSHASDVLVVLLVHLVACLAISEFDSVKGARLLQVAKRPEDRRGIGLDTTPSKGLVDLVDGPPVAITGGKERGDGVTNVAWTGHVEDYTSYASFLQNLLLGLLSSVFAWVRGARS
jgi:hypothetical protein